MFNYKIQGDVSLEYIDVCPASELKNGERLFVEVGNRSLVIFNVAGDFYAIGDVCSHDDGPVGDGELDGFTIICPRHGAEFDIRTGKVMQMPAVVDIPAYPVRVVSGQLQIGVPK